MRKYLWYMMLLFTALTGFYFFYGWAQLPAGHRYIYPLDDVYIHLALARNFAEHGIWSINTSGFDSASSSVLYTLLLAMLIKVFGDWEYYPLILNILFGYFTVYAVYRYFRDFFGKNELVWALVLLQPFTLLYMTALLGMEHTIHMFLMVLAIYFIHKNVKSDFQIRDFSVLLMITFFISIIRFESMFFTVSLAFALFLRKNFVKGIIVLGVGLLPIVVFGIISENHGGYFFPNSVMIKGRYPAGSSFVISVWQLFRDGIILNTSFYKCLFFPNVILLVYLIRKYRFKDITSFLKEETLLITIVCIGFLQALFAFLKYRYENYIMIAVLMLIIPIISDYFQRFRKVQFKTSCVAVGISSLAIFAISVYRFGYHHLPLKLSSKGINEQQIEMSRFLAIYYKGEKVLANDIGAISYFSHVRLLDVVGLGSTEVAKVKVSSKYNTSEVSVAKIKAYLTTDVKKNHYCIAVIYPEWFPGDPPLEWIPVASWTISEKYGPAIRRVVFYALSREEVRPLRENLSRFHLNPNVKQWFYIYR